MRALVRYIPEEDDIRIVKTWSQRPKDGHGSAWVKPFFSKKTRAQWKVWARDAYNRNYKRDGHVRDHDDDKEELKGHCQELCERCQERGICVQRRTRSSRT